MRTLAKEEGYSGFLVLRGTDEKALTLRFLDLALIKVFALLAKVFGLLAVGFSSGGSHHVRVAIYNARSSTHYRASGREIHLSLSRKVYVFRFCLRAILDHVAVGTRLSNADRRP
jgi:hypothetical protein